MVLNIKYKGNTLPEILIAIAIITLISAIGVTIYLNIQQNTQPFIKAKANELAIKYLQQSQEKNTFMDEQFKEEEFSIKKTISRLNEYPDCVVMKISVSTKQEKKISEVQKIIYANQ